MSEAEFDRIKVAIEGAANILGDAIEREGDLGWDYLIVAVPHARKLTRVAMMSSVMPEALPHFIKFIEVAFRTSQEKGLVIDDRKPEGEPS